MVIPARVTRTQVRTPQGTPIVDDVTRHGLHRLCVMSGSRYPDLQDWLAYLPKGAEVQASWYTEEIKMESFIGYLWIYYK